VTCVLGFVFAGGVHILSWLSLSKWHDSYHRSDT